MEDKNVLVTGGTGFIGSHLIEELVRQKANIVTTFISTSPLSYFFTQKLNKKVKMTHLDVENYEGIFELVVKNDIEYIFHLAAQALVDVGYHNPKRTLSTNILGTVNVLEAARLFPKVKAVIVASSDKAYGKLGKTSEVEGKTAAVWLKKNPFLTAAVRRKDKYVESDPLRGDHPYEVSKSSADLIAYSYFKTYAVPVITTRFGNVYGEGDLNFSRIIPGIMKSIISNEILDIRSDGRYVRDYLYVKDVVDGYLKLAQSIDNLRGEAFNFGSNETFSVLDLIKVVEERLKKKIKYEILNKAINEIPYQSLDYSKIKNKLGWSPKCKISYVIKKVKKWYQGILT